MERGGPDGGDGGRGGHIILKADRNRNSLEHIFYAPRHRAGDGGDGSGKTSHGRNGSDYVLPIPCGTQIRDRETGVLLGDLLEHEQELIVARGGKGGLGNVHWKSSTHQAPHEHTNGAAGEEVTLDLELKIVANVGLVGFPNAGKSSLLTAISDAHPKIAAYPFTTLNPVIGTVFFEDYTSVTVADIPGLIEGANYGVGLGHAFLRHVERAPLLVYVVDMAGSEGRNPYEDYKKVREELKLHRADLIKRPSLIVANKMDQPEAAKNLAEFKRKTRRAPLLISALTGEGVEKFKKELHRLCVKNPAKK